MVETKQVKREVDVNGCKVTLLIDDINKLKEAVSKEKYVNRLALRLDISSINKEHVKPVPFYLKFQNDNLQSKNPRNGKNKEDVI